MNKILTIIISSLLIGISYTVLAAPPYNIFRTINPETDNIYDVGSSTLRWRNIYGTNFIGDGSQLTGITGGSGSVGTSSPVVAGYFPYWANATQLAGSSSLYQSGTKIGIGTTTPPYLFSVVVPAYISSTAFALDSTYGAVGIAIPPGNATLNLGSINSNWPVININTTSSAALISVLNTSAGNPSISFDGKIQGQTQNDELLFYLAGYGWMDTPIGSTSIAQIDAQTTGAGLLINNTHYQGTSITATGKAVFNSGIDVTGITTSTNLSVSQNATTTNLTITGLASATNPCLRVNSLGVVSTTNCFTTTTINGLTATAYTFNSSSTGAFTISTSSLGTIQFGINNTPEFGTSTFLGYVSVGSTTVPDAPLVVVGKTGVGNVLNIRNQGASTHTMLNFYNANSNPASWRNIFSAFQSRGSLSDPTDLIADDQIFSVVGNAYYDGAFRSPVSFDFKAGATPGASSFPGYITFATTNTGATSRSERVRISEAGYLGVGDTSPDQQLEVYSTSDTQISITAVGINKDAILGYQLTDGTNLFSLGVDDSDGDKFKISTTALGTNDRLVIDSSGNVGIGTSTPNSKFTVNGGDVYITSSTVPSGLVLASPNGTCYRITITNGGDFATSSIACP